jgi:DNA-binding CsgD family transcriptional regulator
MSRSLEPRESSRWDLVDGSSHPREHKNGRVTVSALTPRQREIAGLLAKGLPNADIAQQLVLTTGTVANHVASILQRLELDSRTQVAAWAVENGLHGGQDRLLTMLERLLEMQPATVKSAMDHVANLVAEALGADKVDAFLHNEATATLVAVGISETPLGHKQRALGLDHQALANGGRVAQVFLTGQAHADGDVQQDKDELIGIRHELNVRSQLAGPGIDPALLPRLFERFARSSTSTGLGIGLVLSRQIAEAHGGEVEVTSRPRRGTQFRLFLPPEPG